MATLTYVYSDSTAVLGPLATYAEPHSYDLCEGHAARLTAPRGWEVVRLQVDDHGPAGPSHDDLLALVEAVREAAREPGPRGSRAGRLPAAAGDRAGLLRDPARTRPARATADRPGVPDGPGRRGRARRRPARAPAGARARRRTTTARRRDRGGDVPFDGSLAD